MQKDAQLMEGIFDKHRAAPLNDLLNALVDALVEAHRNDARVRGVVYQNLGRLGLIHEAQDTRQQIQARGASVLPEMEPGLTWVALTAISSIIFSMSQLPPQHRDWNFARTLCHHTLTLLVAPLQSGQRMKDRRSKSALPPTSHLAYLTVQSGKIEIGARENLAPIAFATPLK